MRGRRGKVCGENTLDSNLGHLEAVQRIHCSLYHIEALLALCRIAYLYKGLRGEPLHLRLIIIQHAQSHVDLPSRGIDLCFVREELPVSAQLTYLREVASSVFEKVVMMSIDINHCFDELGVMLIPSEDQLISEQVDSCRFS